MTRIPTPVANACNGSGLRIVLLIFLAGIAVYAVCFAPIERRVLRDRGLAPEGRRP